MNKRTEAIRLRILWGTTLGGDEIGTFAFGQHLFGQSLFGGQGGAAQGLSGGGQVGNARGNVQISKSVEDWTGEFIPSDLSFEFVDPKREVYATMYNGRRPLFSYLQLQGQLPGSSSWEKFWTGITWESSWQDGVFSVSARDELQLLKDARFAYDYSLVGTVDSFNGSLAFISYTTAPRYLDATFSLSPYPQDRELKFGSSVRDFDPIVRISSATRLSGTVSTVNMGTNIKLSAPMYVYMKDLLTFDNNPGQVWYDIMTGALGSTTFTIGDDRVDKDIWGVSTRANIQFNVVGTIWDDGTGAVYDTVKELANSVQANIWVKENGQFCFSAIRPLTSNPKSVDISTNIVTSPNPYETGEDFYTDFTTDFDWGLNEEDRNIQFRRKIQRGYYESASAFYNKRRQRSNISLRYVDDREQAEVITQRFGIKHSDGIKRMQWSMPMGESWDVNIDDIHIATLSAGSYTGHPFRVIGYNKEINGGVSSLDLIDSKQQSQGFGYWSAGRLGAVSTDFGSWGLQSGTAQGISWEGNTLRTGTLVSYVNGSGCNLFEYHTYDGTYLGTTVGSPCYTIDLADFDIDTDGTYYLGFENPNASLIHRFVSGTEVGSFAVSGLNNNIDHVCYSRKDNRLWVGAGSIFNEYDLDGNLDRTLTATAMGASGAGNKSGFIYGSYLYMSDQDSDLIRGLSLISGSLDVSMIVDFGLNGVKFNTITGEDGFIMKADDAFDVSRFENGHVLTVGSMSDSGWGTMLVSDGGTVAGNGGTVKFTGTFDGEFVRSADLYGMRNLALVTLETGTHGVDHTDSYFRLDTDGEEVFKVIGGFPDKMVVERFQFNTREGSVSFGSAKQAAWVGSTFAGARANVQGTVINLPEVLGTVTRWF